MLCPLTPNSTNLVEVGLHSAGSFGTVGRAPVGFNGAAGAAIRHVWNVGVGLSADFNRDGWSVGTPTAFSGDYVMPGSAMEGWVVSWRNTSTGAVNTGVNKGRMVRAIGS
jgi:hypothetical protein